MEETLNTHNTPTNTNMVLVAAFGSDEPVTGVFLIEAKSRNTFLNRKRQLEKITGFSDGFMDAFEEDDEGGIWRLITEASFDDIDDLKKSFTKMRKYNWLFLSDSCVMFDNEYIFSDGKWFL